MMKYTRMVMMEIQQKLVQPDQRKQIVKKRSAKPSKRKEVDTLRVEFEALKAQTEMRICKFEEQLAGHRKAIATERKELETLRAEFVVFRAYIDLHMRELEEKLMGKWSALD
ncbi:hypothetical protein PMIN06_007375 [Paraphaeosphaeria minitans]